MRSWWVVNGAIFFAAAIFGFVIWLEVNAWNECLETNSFWYCIRILDR